jgi:hypothetical protein
MSVGVDMGAGSPVSAQRGFDERSPCNAHLAVFTGRP